MELSAIGADLLGVSESKVLRALARLADPVSGRQLTRLAGLDSHSTAQRYLNRLSRIGLVEVTEVGSARLYRPNRRHVFWQPIEDLLASPARIDQAIAEVVAEELGSAGRIAAFGSVARGTSSAESDYDLLLIVEDDVPTVARERTVFRLIDLVEALTGNPAQVVDLGEGELRNLAAHDAAIVDEWRRSARPLDGRGRIPQLRASA